MATVTNAGSAWTTTAGDKTVTATPAVGDVIVVIAASSGLSGGTTAVTDNNSSGTYTQVDSDRTGFSTTGVLTVWVRNTRIPAANSTIFTIAQSGSTGGGGVVLRIAGVMSSGSTLVRSNGGQSSGTAGTTPAPVLSSTPLTGNVIITAVANGTSGGGTTERASYTDIAITGYNSPTTGLDVCYLVSGETTATLTWGGTSATAFASVGIELNSATAGVATGTGAAYGVTAKVSASAAWITDIGVAFFVVARPGTLAQSGAASATGTAYNATASAPVSALAKDATGTGAAYADTTKVEARGTVVAVSTGAALDATGRPGTLAQADAAVPTGEAYNATVTTSGSVNAYAEVATGTGAAIVTRASLAGALGIAQGRSS